MRRFTHSAWPILAAILLLALTLRLVGLNWDDLSRLHPDERFLTSTTARLGDADNLTDQARNRCPDESTFYEFFNTECSVLNPNNINQGSFAYGTLPLFIVRGSAQQLATLTDDPRWTSYDRMHYVGRGVNALADTLATLFVCLIGWRLVSRRAGLLAAALYAAAVLPIQLAHFWTVDTLAHLFFIIGLYAAVEVARRAHPGWYVLFGLALGAALASRINLFPMALLLPLATLVYLDNQRRTDPIGLDWAWVRRGWWLVVWLFIAAALSFIAFRVFQPYAFAGPTFGEMATLNPKWVEDISEVSNYSRVYSGGWPPSNQWVERLNYAYPWWNMVAWGMGLTLGIIATLGLGWAIYRQVRGWRISPWAWALPVGVLVVATLQGAPITGLWLACGSALAFFWLRADRPTPPLWVLLPAWVVIFFGLTGGIHQMTMRYYLPLYAVLTILAAWFVLQWRSRTLAGALLAATVLWAFAFTNIYREPFTRLEASRWIADNLRPTITLETGDNRWFSGDTSSRALAYELMTVTNRETFLSRPFTLREGARLTAFAVVLPQAQDTRVNVRLLADDDRNADEPLASFQVDMRDAAAGRVPITPDDLPDDLPPGTYLWHIDASWPAEDAFRHLIPIIEWQDRDGDAQQTGLNFLTPYGEVSYAGLGPDNPQPFAVRQAVTLESLYFPHALGNAQTVRVQMGQQEYLARAEPLAEDAVSPLGPARRFQLDDPLTLHHNTQLALLSDAPLYITGTAILTEGSWDDEIPWSFCEAPHAGGLRLAEDCDMLNSFALGRYPVMGLNMAETDGRAKHLRMVNLLSLADYLTISSNRFYDALPRNPQRFPMSNGYYERLFAGELPYDLIQEFSTFPGFLGLTFRDQVLPTSDLPGWVNELEAEEAFTVYDHPTVFLFRNTGFQPEDLPPDFVAPDMRNRIDLDDYQATTFQAPEEAPSDGDVTQTAALWLLGLWALGWLSLPLMWRVFSALPLHGVYLGRGLAWVGLAFVAWWLTAVLGGGLWGRAALWGLLLLYIALNIYLGVLYAPRLGRFIRDHRAGLLSVEGVFLLALMIGVGLRMANPDLWHPSRGGEKPMDFAYLNATLRTDQFPPPNPWMAGFEINYYYFGFVIAALPIKLGGFAPEIGVNLALASLYALISVHVVMLAYHLLGYTGVRRTLRLGLAGLGGAFVMLMGNLATWELFLNPEPNMHPNRWYWYPTRVLAESANRAGGAINEVPLFSFLYGDLHAHMITLLPVTLYLSLLLVLADTRQIRWGAGLGVLAAMIFMGNTWDLLLYIPLAAVVMWLAARHPARFVRLSALVTACGALAIAPFWLHFTLGENGGFERWEGAQSLLSPFLLMWGIPLGVIALWLLYRTKAVLTPDADSPIELGLLILLGGGLLAVYQDDAETATSVLLAGLILIALALARWDRPALRPAHLGVAVVTAWLLLPEYIVVVGDVGRLNTVFKVTFQLWLWLGLLIPVLLAFMLRHKLYIQSGLALALLALGLLYPVQSIPARHADSETGVLTLDGNLFMNTLRLNEHGQPILTARDAALVRWMRANLTRFPVIAEWYEREYAWNSRVSVQTGFPSVIGWANHMRQQYTHQHLEIERRRQDIQLLYRAEEVDDIRYIVTRYEVEYIVLGQLERAAAREDTLQLFEAMLDRGELRVVYDGAETQLLQVTDAFIQNVP